MKVWTDQKPKPDLDRREAFPDWTRTTEDNPPFSLFPLTSLSPSTVPLNTPRLTNDNQRHSTLTNSHQLYSLFSLNFFFFSITRTNLTKTLPTKGTNEGNRIRDLYKTQIRFLRTLFLNFLFRVVTQTRESTQRNATMSHLAMNANANTKSSANGCARYRTTALRIYDLPLDIVLLISRRLPPYDLMHLSSVRIFSFLTHERRYLLILKKKISWIENN